jgi:hypothetical protein
MCQGYIRLKLLTGLRMTDLLNLPPSDIKEDGIHVKASKRNPTPLTAFFMRSPRMIGAHYLFSCSSSN